MHNTLRSFIRETLLVQVRRSQSFIDDRGSLLIREASDEYDVDDAAEAAKFSNIIDKRFALVKDGEPEFTVIADNKAAGKVAIVPYPSDLSRQDYDDEGANVTQERLMRALGATQVLTTSPVIDDIINRTGGWETTDSHVSTVQGMLDQAERLELDSLTNMLLMPRKTELLRRPKGTSTRAAIEAGAQFKCTLPARDVVISIFDIKNPDILRTPEWRMNAACFYEYANSPKGAIVSGITLGLLATMAASESGPFSLAAFISAAGMGATSHDIVMRVPVAAWSAANGKTKFLVANIIYIVIVIIFESLVHFKEAKAALKAGEVVGAKNVASASGNALVKMMLSRLEETPGMSRLSKNELGKIIDGIFKGSITSGDARTSEEFFSSALTAAEKLDFWTPMKLIIVGMTLQLIAALFGDELVEQCRADVEAAVSSDGLGLDALEVSRSELMNDIDRLRQKYPPI